MPIFLIWPRIVIALKTCLQSNVITYSKHAHKNSLIDKIRMAEENMLKNVIKLMSLLLRVTIFSEVDKSERLHFQQIVSFCRSILVINEYWEFLNNIIVTAYLYNKLFPKYHL